MADKVYINEVGKILKLDTGINVDAATSQSVYVNKPDGTVASWDGSIVDSNYVQHTTEAGDLDQSGTYRVQAVVTVGGIERKGNTARFTVYPTHG